MLRLNDLTFNFTYKKVDFISDRLILIFQNIGVYIFVIKYF
jgi:hypothetical protein